MMVGGVLGILFVTLLRRVMVEDPELPFPESVAVRRSTRRAKGGKAAGLLVSRPWEFGCLLYSRGRDQSLYDQRSATSW